MENKNYSNLFMTLAISFVIMYGVMFLNVNDITNIYLSTTRTYMALLMVSPMALIMILLMGKMYKNRKINAAIISTSAFIFIVTLILLRTQTFIGDKDYMKAMIPHHSSAILTSEHAAITDPEVRKLADGIIAAQKKEIDQMKSILYRINN